MKYITYIALDIFLLTCIMFSITLRRVNSICNSVVVRTLRSGRLGPNPGIDRRARELGKEALDLEDGVEDIADNPEPNLLEAGKIVKKFVKESAADRESLRHHIVEQKYFKENLPNLLTWSEKEQIRYLHSEEPDEWTPERIAESFPITPQIVKKLVKYPWKPATMERIARHDASAMRNWQELKEGTLDIPPELREHCLKFSNRTIPPLNKESIKIDVTPSQNLGEFQAIIEKCAKNDTEEPVNHIDPEESSSDEKTKPSPGDNKRLTLDELTSRIKKRMDSGSAVTTPDQLIVESSIQFDNVTLGTSFDEIDVYKSATGVTNFNNKMTGVVIKNYPQRIRIPKKAWKKGGTYRVDDCYYDDDGRFLYRVLGMQQN